jgi:hypothetical protein
MIMIRTYEVEIKADFRVRADVVEGAPSDEDMKQAAEDRALDIVEGLDAIRGDGSWLFEVVRARVSTTTLIGEEPPLV